MFGKDIDALKVGESIAKAFADLKTERDLLSQILAGMQEGVLLLDASGRLSLMNPALREMLLLHSDAIGEPMVEVVRQPELRDLLERARLTPQASAGEVELSGLKPRRLLVRCSSFVGEGGGLIAVFVDVTDVRRLETLRRDFVANVSHELRTPVTAVLSAAETLRGAAAKDPEAFSRFVGIIERNAERLQRLIEDLLDLSRIESREFKLAPTEFPLLPFTQHVLGLFRERAEKKKISLVLDIPAELSLFADKRALEQIQTNLIDNAVKYCPDGSSVTVRGRLDGDDTLVIIEDTGGGIDAHHLPRLFERFYRVDAGRSREVGGTGLGLAIVKHLAEAMGGAISVTSTVGRGTAFTVRLPRTSARTTTTDPPPRP